MVIQDNTQRDSISQVSENIQPDACSQICESSQPNSGSQICENPRPNSGFRIGVIFDCDGTLLDTLGVWEEFECEFARRAGYEFTLEDSNYLATLTIPETGAFMHNQLGLGKDADDVVRMMDEYFIDYYATRAGERPGALSFVRGLHEQGVEMCVASSSPLPYLQAGLKHTGFAPYLKAIISVDDVGASKREPRIYEHAREILGTPPESTWVFEDAAYALRTVRGVGFHTVGIYDCDISGMRKELKELADIYLESFEGFTAEKFLEQARALA